MPHLASTVRRFCNLLSLAQSQKPSEASFKTLMAHAEFTATAVTPRAPHAHKHGRASDSRRRLSVVLVLTAIYMVAEVVGGW